MHFLISLSMIGENKSQLEERAKAIAEWEDTYYLGYVPLPLKRVSTASSDISVRPIDPQHVAELTRLVVNQNSLNFNMKVVVRSKDFLDYCRQWFEEGKDFDDLGPYLTEHGELKIEVFSGNHSLESMKLAVSQNPGSRIETRINELRYHVYGLDDTNREFIAVVRDLAMRINADDDKRKKTTFIGHLSFINNKRIEYISLGKKIKVKSFCKDIAPLLHQHHGYVEKAWQLVRDPIEYSFVNALLVDAETEYGYAAAKAKKKTRRQRRPPPVDILKKNIEAQLTEETKLLPVPRMMALADFSNLFGLPTEARIRLLKMLYNRQFTVEEFKQRCLHVKAVMSFTTAVINFINGWIQDTKSKEPEVADWEDVTKRYEQFLTNTWFDGWIQVVLKNPKTASGSLLKEQVRKKMQLMVTFYYNILTVFLGWSQSW